MQVWIPKQQKLPIKFHKYKKHSLRFRKKKKGLSPPVRNRVAHPLQRFKWRHFVRFNFMVAKSCFATLAIVESALDSALAESIESILHALRVSLTLATLVVRSFGFKVEVSATAKAKCDRE